MPTPPSQAVRLVENNLNKYGPGLEIMRKNGFVFGALLRQGKLDIFSYRKKWIRSQKSTSPSTDANDNCQPASNNCVGLMSKRIIAAKDNVLMGLGRRRKKNDTQKTQHIIAALNVGALGGTINKKITITIIQTTARAGFINPVVLHSHQIIPIKIPRCNPERLIKCSRPVLRKASYVSLSISRL